MNNHLTGAAFQTVATALDRSAASSMGKGIIVTRLKPTVQITSKAEPLAAERKVFQNAFEVSYNQVPAPLLQLPVGKSLVDFLEEAFEEDLSAFRNCADTSFEDSPHAFYSARCALDNKVIGYLSVDMDEKRGHAYLRQLAVDPERQRTGVARALVNAAFADAPLAEWTVSYRSFNSSAEKLYMALGFEQAECCHLSLDPQKYRGMVKRAPK